MLYERVRAHSALMDPHSFVDTNLMHPWALELGIQPTLIPGRWICYADIGSLYWSRRSYFSEGPRS
jgi:hypothetical protein